jgi:hypothetical protein
MRTIEISDFSGGLYEATAPSDYRENQWSQLKGFILENENVLISQFPLQSVGTATGFREVAGITARDGFKFLVGIKTDLTVWYTEAHGTGASVATVNGSTWTAMPNINLGGNLMLRNDNMQFLGEMTSRYPSTAQTDFPLSPALLISQAVVTDGGIPSQTLTDYNVVIIAEAFNKIGAYHYRKNVTYGVTQRETSSGTATLNLNGSHLFRNGDSITITGVAAAYNGTFTITGISADRNYTKISYVTGGANEALTSSTGSVTGTVGSIYPGYTPAMPSNVTATQSGTDVIVAWTNEASGSDATIRGYNIYDGDEVFIATVTGFATTYTYTGTANGAIVQPFNNYGITPLDAIGGVTAPAPGIIPKANVSAYWGGQLVLADIEYFKDPTVLDQNVPLTNRVASRIRNGIWFSNPNTIDTFDPLAVFTVGTPETTIMSLVVVPQGLLIFTFNTNDGSGLFLLRGSSIGLVSEEEVVLNSTLELIRSDVSTYIRQDEVRGYPGSGITARRVANWPVTGTVVFLDDVGKVMQTNGQDVAQLDQYAMAFDGVQPARSPSLATVGNYLFMRRNSKLFCMRDLEGKGAWTEMDYAGSSPRAMIGFDNCLYYVDQNGQVYRYVVYPAGAINNDRGKFNNDATFALSVATRPVGDANRFNKQFWHRVGVRAYGGPSGQIISMESFAASSLISGSVYVDNTIQPVTTRFEKVYPMHGPSEEACVRFTFQGYVVIEGITFYVHGGQQRRL